MLSKTQFELLTCLEKAQERLTQRQMAKELQLSLATLNRLHTELQDAGLVNAGQITDAGREALQPYRVKRAIFIAAGFGSRLVPITLNTPKPLVRVGGVRIIDTLLDAVIAAGIEEIIIVRGYLHEQFDQLLYKYPQIKFVENTGYNEANNILSVLKVAGLLENAYVFEADLLLRNPALVTRYQYESNYLGVKVDRTDDWCFECTSSGTIRKLSIGGTDCYHMFGISFWTKKDADLLENEIGQVYDMPGGHERYWDQVPLEYFIKNHQVKVRPCTFDDIVEIDTFKELKALDSTYDVR